MSCSCSTDDGPEVFWESNPTARTNHICGECESTIDPGEKYRLSKGVWEGKFAAFKTCEACQPVWDTAVNEYGCICFGELWETVGVEFE